jgi:hypothetical protein
MEETYNKILVNVKMFVFCWSITDRTQPLLSILVHFDVSFQIKTLTIKRHKRFELVLMRMNKNGNEKEGDNFCIRCVRFVFENRLHIEHFQEERKYEVSQEEVSI